VYTAQFECVDKTGLLYSALKPEEAKGKRFDLRIVQKKGVVLVSVKAADAVALKAITHSVVHMIETAEKVNNDR
jgi:tRNA threonylcarbamoyladenosine modification (KEOPS) complex  Pcc1 subunit